MKKFTLILILAAVGFSHSAKSQLFSNTYDLSTKFYFNEEHTAMAVYKDEVVAVATSVTGYTNFRHMSIELLDTYSGAPVSRRYEYQVNGISTLAQEIQTSVSDSRRLAALGAYPISGALPSEGLVFYDTDPNTGNVAWATTLGSSSYYLEGCSFVKDEREKTYFVLASHYENDIIITGPSNAFLCRLDHAGNPIWEMRYEDVVHESSIISKDLVYDEKHQQLQSLPETLGRLGELRELNLSNNQLTTLPTSMARLTHLRELNLSGNQLTTLPKVVKRLPALKIIHLQYTKIPSKELESLKTQLPGVKISPRKR